MKTTEYDSDALHSEPHQTEEKVVVSIQDILAEEVRLMCPPSGKSSEHLQTFSVLMTLGFTCLVGLAGLWMNR